MFHTAELTKKGEVWYTWGHNYFGQLGHGDTRSRKTPTKVSSLNSLVITQRSCGYDHTAALMGKGETLTWYAQVMMILDLSHCQQIYNISN